MGSGASTQASENVQAASVEDLQAALANLPAEDRAKVGDALAAAQAPAAEVKAAAEEEKAPFLAEYFDKAKARTEALVGDPEKLLQAALDPELQKKLEEESKAWYEAEAKPLLKKSFKHHDSKNTDVLDKDEAAAFFANLVSEETDFAKALSAVSMEAAMKTSMAMLDQMGKEEREAIKPMIEEQMKSQIQKANAEVQKKEDAYKADKAAHDAAAMKVLDTNGDGTIQLEEFLRAFEPESEMNTKLHLALGWVTQEEIEAQKKAAEEAKAAAECNQQ